MSTDGYGMQKPTEDKPVEKDVASDERLEEAFDPEAAARYQKAARDSMRDENGLLPSTLRTTWEEWTAPFRYPDAAERAETYSEWRTRITNGGARGPTAARLVAYTPPPTFEVKEENPGNTGPYSSFGRPRQ
jgi:hypothetical protein